MYLTDPPFKLLQKPITAPNAPNAYVFTFLISRSPRFSKKTKATVTPVASSGAIA